MTESFQTVVSQHPTGHPDTLPQPPQLPICFLSYRCGCSDISRHAVMQFEVFRDQPLSRRGVSSRLLRAAAIVRASFRLTAK